MFIVISLYGLPKYSSSLPAKHLWGFPHVVTRGEFWESAPHLRWWYDPHSTWDVLTLKMYLLFI